MARSREQTKPKSHPNGSGLWFRAVSGWRWLWADVEGSPSLPLVAPELKRNESAAAAVSGSTEHGQSAKTETQTVFTQVSMLKIIAWLGASAGGLTILLVVIGFLALSAHDAMLGIPRSIQNNPEYVAVGGLFFGRSVIFLVASLISPKSWIVAGVLIIGAIMLFRHRQRHSRGRSMLIVLFSILLLVAEVYGLARLIKPLQISNLLLNGSVDATSPGKQVIEAILVKDTTFLSVEYGFLVLLVVTFSVAFLMLEQESRDRLAATGVAGKRLLIWHVIRVPAFILLLICIFLLPRAYGVLTVSNDYPSAIVESSDPSTTVKETRLLLREDDKVFVLYEPASQSIITIKRESVTRHRVYAPQHVFTASTVRE